MVCKTKDEGGLGIINLELQNQALLMKNLDKFYNGREIPWVNLIWEKYYRNDKIPGTVKKGSFWWRDILKMLPLFKEMTTVKIKNGASCFFWKDTWASQALEQEFPQAYSFAKNKNMTVKKAFNHNDITEMFTLPLSQVAFDQLTTIQQIMENTILEEHSKDIWLYPGERSK